MKQLITFALFGSIASAWVTYIVVCVSDRLWALLLAGIIDRPSASSTA